MTALIGIKGIKGKKWNFEKICFSTMILLHNPVNIVMLPIFDGLLHVIKSQFILMG
jgi:hypothetical protein